MSRPDRPVVRPAVAPGLLRLAGETVRLIASYEKQPDVRAVFGTVAELIERELA